MRMRHKPNLQPRMEKCAAVQIKDPENYIGKWKTEIPGFNKLHLELGCGKGRFTSDTAITMPDTLLLAIEKVADALIIAMERIMDREQTNVRFINGDVANLKAMFSEGEIDRIYINFCDPWPKSRDAKFRLTAPGFLRTYCDTMPIGGQIHFKTDNTPLFDWSLEQFTNEGWELSEVTHDLHVNGPVGIMTDYEAKFYADGLKINRLVATKTDKTLGTSAGPVARIHNASLTDARGYIESKTANGEEVIE